MPKRPLTLLALLLASTHPLRADNSLAKPPHIPPYQIPTFSGQPRDFKHLDPAIKPAMDIDSDQLFKSVVNCFPERVKWGLELDAVAGSRYTDQPNSITTFDSSGLARHYVGVVAKMPLYSAEELNRQRQSEYTRREEVAKNVEKLLSALATQRRAKRQLGLFTSLEARSQERVALGLADATEQVSYLEKVIEAQSTLDDAEAGLDGARLALIGQCRDEMAEQVNNYILQVLKE